MGFAATAVRNKVKLSWLDLRGSALSAVERLCLEEVLLRHDPEERCWAILGTHEPTSHSILRNVPTPPHIMSAQDPNRSCIIVMGIGGKPESLLNMDLVKNDGVQVIKRFSGGGTVVLDHSSLWTTFIGRTKDLPHVESFPSPIMAVVLQSNEPLYLVSARSVTVFMCHFLFHLYRWTADRVFGPAFSKLSQDALAQPLVRNKKTLVVDSKSCGASENSGRVIELPGNDEVLEIPDFSLRENDYVLGERKMGGNAQSIIKGGWLHHTSFLWDYEDDNMEYLSLPSKRPEYRANRSHEDFLVKLKTYYGQLRPQLFFAHVKASCADDFDIQDVTLKEALSIANDQVGGMQNWFETKCRTKIVNL